MKHEEEREKNEKCLLSLATLQQEAIATRSAMHLRNIALDSDINFG